MTDIRDRLSIMQKFIIDLSKYNVLSKINQGGFSNVYMVEDKFTKEKFAAKILSTTDYEESNKTMINREISIMMRLQHPTFIHFYGYSLQDFYGQNRVTIIMSLAKNGSLATILQNAQKGLADLNYDNTARQKILIGIARGMMYLHQNHIIHRDLKPGNILIDELFQPHITDFGLSKIYLNDQTQSHTQTLGTSIYMAPEVIKGDRYNGKADVYSFAILMFEVVTDTTPYPLFQSKKMSLFEFNNKIVNEGYRPKFTVHVKEPLKKLIEKCWSADPKERPTFDEIFNKLAFNIEESVYDVFADEEENKFYLENVDADEVLSYAYEITEDKTSAGKLTEVLADQITKENERIRKENEKMAKDIEQIKKENAKIVGENKKLSNENQMMIQNFNSIKEEVELLKKQIEKLSKNAPLEKAEKTSNKKVEKVPMSHTKSSEPSKQSVACFIDESKPNQFCGIISYLTDKCGGNVHDKNVVKVTSSTICNDRGTNNSICLPKNAVDFNKTDTRIKFATKDLPNQWLKYDFLDHKVCPTHYLIKARGDVKCHNPKSWVIEGSNTDKNDDWTVLDQQTRVEYLNGLNYMHTFAISSGTTTSFRYLRIRQTEENFTRRNYFNLSALEYFGTLY